MVQVGNIRKNNQISLQSYFTSALPPKPCKAIKKSICIYLYIYKHDSTFKFDVFEMVQVGRA